MEADTDLAGMAGMRKMEVPPAFSLMRLGYGIEMTGAPGNTRQFGFDWRRQQQHVGPVFSYAVSKRWTVRVAPAFGGRDSNPETLVQRRNRCRPASHLVC